MRRYDYNLIVIGAGSAGLVSALIGATVGAKVALIEQGKMGGDCLNTGCVPSKALLRSAKVAALMRRAGEFGLRTTAPEVDFAAVMDRVRTVIDKVAPHDSAERFTALGVECIEGHGRITSPFQVQVQGRTLSTRNIIVASGASPRIPPLPGLDGIDFLTSGNLWALREPPGRLLVLGGGAIGCELSQAFTRLGVDLTQVQRGPRLLPQEDPEVSALVRTRFEAEGVRVYTDHAAVRVEQEGTGRTLVCLHQGQEVRLPFDRLLLAVGRKAHTKGLGLEELGVDLTPAGTIQVNPYMQTTVPSIYCAGDVAGPYQFTHTAAHQAWYASVNALFGGIKRFKVDYRVIPRATFTDPEIASVGLNETEAERRGIPCEVSRFDLGELDRAITDAETDGMVKVLTKPGRDRILGVTVVGSHAGDTIAEYVLAMRHGLGLNKMLRTIHIYPTLAEGNKYAAGVWKKARLSPWLLALLGRYQRWRRG